MADSHKPFDYVPIVVDDDWGLVGIIPRGDAGNRIKKLSDKSISNPNLELSRSTSQTNAKISEATIVGRRRPVTKILNDALITPAESDNTELMIRQGSHPHSLIGLVQTSPSISFSGDAFVPEKALNTFKDLSSVPNAKRRDSVLVGYQS